MNRGESAPTETGSPRGWWLLGLPVVICLPCVLPALVVGFLAIGGAGAIGSSVSGGAGPLALAGGVPLVGVSAVVYLSRRHEAEEIRDAR